MVVGIAPESLDSDGSGSLTAGVSGGSFTDLNATYSSGNLNFRTTLEARYAGLTDVIPRPLGGGTRTMGRNVAGTLVAMPVTVSVSLARATPSSISAMVTKIDVVFPIIVYYNTQHFTFRDGTPSLATQYAENQHAVDFWNGRDAQIIPMLQRRLGDPFVGTQAAIEAEIRGAIMNDLYRINRETGARCDYEGGPHRGGENPIPSGYGGFVR